MRVGVHLETVLERCASQTSEAPERLEPLQQQVAGMSWPARCSKPLVSAFSVCMCVCVPECVLGLQTLG